MDGNWGWMGMESGHGWELGMDGNGVRSWMETGNGVRPWMGTGNGWEWSQAMDGNWEWSQVIDGNWEWSQVMDGNWEWSQVMDGNWNEAVSASAHCPADPRAKGTDTSRQILSPGSGLEGPCAFQGSSVVQVGSELTSSAGEGSGDCRSSWKSVSSFLFQHSYQDLGQMVILDCGCTQHNFGEGQEQSSKAELGQKIGSLEAALPKSSWNWRIGPLGEGMGLEKAQEELRGCRGHSVRHSSSTITRLEGGTIRS
ncbi:hypothetical protein TURU_124542 [Turdus rufiventris]|nr:hypothetical protein TURU_124542 [Turdus rufiventris]